MHRGNTHVIAETQKGTLAYYFKLAGKSWTDCDAPLCVLTNVHRARFSETAKGLCLITGSANGGELLVRKVSNARLSGEIDWSKIHPTAIAVPDRSFAEPSAIYVESRSYQTAPVKGDGFAIVGHYPETDSQIWFVRRGR
jgi:hypothetical protein